MKLTGGFTFYVLLIPHKVSYLCRLSRYMMRSFSFGNQKIST